MRQIQWFDSHFYKVMTPRGVEYFPSVTTILQATPKPELARWRGELGNVEAERVINEARSRGTMIHDACARVANGAVAIYDVGDRDGGPTPEEMREIAKYREVVKLRDQEAHYQVYKFTQLLEALNPQVREIEEKVYSLEHKFAGTIDYLMDIKEGRYAINGSKMVELEGGSYICDLKTGKHLSDDYGMQLGAYMVALGERLPSVTVKGGLVIHTNATTKSGIEGLAVRYYSLRDLVAEFEKFLNVYKVYEMNPLQPKVFAMPSLLQWAPKEKPVNPRNTTLTSH